jgi:hypothetical protein
MYKVTNHEGLFRLVKGSIERKKYHIKATLN